jgi:cytochrome c-type biogenesis protein CcmE
MKPVQIGAAIVSVMGIGLAAGAFLLNASPYVTVAEAKATSRSSVHLAGDILKDTMAVRPAQGFVRFMVRDEKGETIPVVYRGAPPGNMGTATKVVAVGQVKDGTFEASKIILKCPSKYEAEAQKPKG